MYQMGCCPRCQSNIVEARLNQTPVVCQACGFVTQANELAIEKKGQAKFIKVATSISVFVLASLIQSASWGNYSTEIVPLQLKSMVGMASAEDYQKIADICIERLKHDCVEQAFRDLAQTGNIEALASLGKYQAKQHKVRPAYETFQSYFAKGGLDLEASYQYAKVLSEIGQVDLASNYYDQVIKAKPETLQITVTQSYVRMLIQNGRTDQAKKIIENVRKSSSNANLFMEEEYKSLKTAGTK